MFVQGAPPSLAFTVFSERTPGNTTHEVPFSLAVHWLTTGVLTVDIPCTAERDASGSYRCRPQFGTSCTIYP